MAEKLNSNSNAENPGAKQWEGINSQVSERIQDKQAMKKLASEVMSAIEYKELSKADQKNLMKGFKTGELSLDQLDAIQDRYKAKVAQKESDLKSDIDNVVEEAISGQPEYRYDEQDAYDQYFEQVDAAQERQRELDEYNADIADVKDIEEEVKDGGNGEPTAEDILKGRDPERMLSWNKEALNRMNANIAYVSRRIYDAQKNGKDTSELTKRLQGLFVVVDKINERRHIISEHLSGRSAEQSEETSEAENIVSAEAVANSLSDKEKEVSQALAESMRELNNPEERKDIESSFDNPKIKPGEIKNGSIVRTPEEMAESEFKNPDFVSRKTEKASTKDEQVDNVAEKSKEHLSLRDRIKAAIKKRLAPLLAAVGLASMIAGGVGGHLENANIPNQTAIEQSDDGAGYDSQNDAYEFSDGVEDDIRADISVEEEAQIKEELGDVLQSLKIEAGEKKSVEELVSLGQRLHDTQDLESFDRADNGAFYNFNAVDGAAARYAEFGGASNGMSRLELLQGEKGVEKSIPDILRSNMENPNVGVSALISGGDTVLAEYGFKNYIAEANGDLSVANQAFLNDVLQGENGAELQAQITGALADIMMNADSANIEQISGVQMTSYLSRFDKNEDFTPGNIKTGFQTIKRNNDTQLKFVKTLSDGSQMTLYFRPGCGWQAEIMVKVKEKITPTKTVETTTVVTETPPSETPPENTPPDDDTPPDDTPPDDETPPDDDNPPDLSKNTEAQMRNAHDDDQMTGNLTITENMDDHEVTNEDIVIPDSGAQEQVIEDMSTDNQYSNVEAQVEADNTQNQEGQAVSGEAAQDYFENLMNGGQ